MDNAVVLLSGGLDSTVALFWAKARFPKVYALGFDYGQRHRSELAAAVYIADKAGVRFECLTVTALSEIGGGLVSGSPIPALDSKQAEVPGRNLTFLTLAAAFGKTRNAPNIVIGCNGDDTARFPDCRSEFLDAAQAVLRACIGPEIKVWAPWEAQPKSHVVAIASRYRGCRELLPETVSCYHGVRGDGCGKCGACRIRAEAFNAPCAVREGNNV